MRTKWDSLLLPEIGGSTDVPCGLCLGEGLASGTDVLIGTAEELDFVVNIDSVPRRSNFQMSGRTGLSLDLCVGLTLGAHIYACAPAIYLLVFRLDVVEMPWMALHNEESYPADVEHSCAIGLTARAAIRLREISAIDAVLTPQPRALERRKRILAASGPAEDGICSLASNVRRLGGER